jgi:hypothetical protein
MKPGRQRAILGFFLIAISYPLGWPAVGLFAGLAIYLKEPMIGIIGGPAVYIFSWLVLLAGIFLVGKDSYRHFREGGLRAVWRGMLGNEKK